MGKKKVILDRVSRGSYVNNWEKSIPSRSYNQCKDLKARAWVMFLESKKEYNSKRENKTNGKRQSGNKNCKDFESFTKGHE